MTEQEGINRAGDVLVEQLTLIASDNTVIDLNEFVVELNLFEDLFSNFLHGNLVLSDSRNLIEKLNLHGEEVLILKVRTPSLDKIHTISKTFRTYKISDRKIVRDNNTQTFVIHFTSFKMNGKFTGALYVSVSTIPGKIVNIPFGLCIGGFLEIA